MAQMVDADVYAVAAQTSEVKLISINVGKGSTQGGSTTALTKSQTLVEHRREAISVSFNANVCATIATDNRVIVYRITDIQSLR